MGLTNSTLPESFGLEEYKISTKRIYLKLSRGVCEKKRNRSRVSFKVSGNILYDTIHHAVVKAILLNNSSSGHMHRRIEE